MCGIVGGISKDNIVPIILNGLLSLEYRGYDSVGIAIINDQHNLIRERCTNRVNALITQCDNHIGFKGNIGIGHTRWATHGVVNIPNSHPHFSSDTLAIVHNGIIENYIEKRQELINHGYLFTSDTDTEVIIHLIHLYYVQFNDMFVAVCTAIKELIGAYAIAVINKQVPDKIICVSNGAPLVIGINVAGIYFASDISAILPLTKQVVYLEGGDIACLTINNYEIYDSNINKVVREVVNSNLLMEALELGSYHHFMQKEISAQPQAINDTLEYLGNSFNEKLFGDDALTIFQNIDSVHIIACGTSYNAGLMANFFIEEIANIPCSTHIASEYRYRNIIVNPNSLIINISQSGETADTIACIRHLHELGMHYTLAICNVDESTLCRISKLCLLTKAGHEIGVAATKTFTAQLLSLLYLAYTLAKVRGNLDNSAESKAIQELKQLPMLVAKMLLLEPILINIAQELTNKEHMLILGRNLLYPIAIEGALKIKEVAYIHAESYAAGELKHGPLALIDEHMPVIVLMSSSILFNKIKSNTQEILARNGLVYLLTDADADINHQCYKTIKLDINNVSKYLLPILYTIPLQLLAYHIAIAKGTDVDKPRNLAKSVTVE